MRNRGWFAGGIALALAILGDGAAAEAAPVTIMPFGDSITYGYSSPTPIPGGYRSPLYRDLIGAGFNVQFVGSSTLNPDPSLPAAANAHEGHPGYLIDGRAPYWNTVSINTYVNQWLGPSGPNPNLILLMLGSNNIYGQYDAAASPYELASLMTRISELRPNAQILVSTLIPQLLPANEAEVQMFNKTMSGPDGIVAQLQKQGEKVRLFDLGSLLTPSDMSDGVHPNSSGYNKLAQGWFGAIESVLPPPLAPAPAPEPSTLALFGSGIVIFLAFARIRRKTACWLAVFLLIAIGTGEARASSLTIMPIGDSITYGFSRPAPVPGGYRAPLYRDLTGAGYNVQFVGSSTLNPDPSLPAAANFHEGHIGYHIDFPPPENGLAGNLATWIGPKGANPDVVLLMIGLNNIIGGQHVQSGPYELGALITQITELRPNAQVIVSTLTPLASFRFEAKIRTFNANLEGPDGVISQLQKRHEKVTLVDLGSLLTSADLSDGIHPSREGYNKLATGWFQAIEAVVPPPLLPNPAPEPSTLVIFGLGLVVSLFAARFRARKDGS